MKKWTVLPMLAAVAALTIAVPADAKRMGGGRSIGKSSTTMQRDGTPPAPAQAPSAAPGAAGAAAPAAAPAFRQGAPAAAAAQQAGRSRWMAPLAGIAAGLGLAWLASSLGFGEELATMMLIGLAIMAALALFAFLRSRRNGAAAGPRPAYAGAAGTGSYRTDTLGQEAATGGAWNRPTPAAPASVSGNDAIERNALGQPLARSGLAGATAGAGLGGAAVEAPAATGRVPAGFDVDGFVRNAKVMFVRLQAAFDASDVGDLREFTSPQMFGELKLEIDERAGSRNVTDVVSLDAQLLGVETVGDEHEASVRFTGMIREEDGTTGTAAAAHPFDEVWVLTKPVAGSQGWVLAGIQQLS